MVCVQNVERNTALGGIVREVLLLSELLSESEWEQLDPLIKKLDAECYDCAAALRTFNKDCLSELRTILRELNQILKERKTIKKNLSETTYNLLLSGNFESYVQLWKCQDISDPDLKLFLEQTRLEIIYEPDNWLLQRINNKLNQREVFQKWFSFFQNYNFTFDDFTEYLAGKRDLTFMESEGGK